MIDGYETNSAIFNGTTDAGSDPNNSDSDGDGFSDGYEVYTNYDPNTEDATPDGEVFIQTAIELKFQAANGGVYRIEHTEDVNSNNWTTVEDAIEGNGGLIERLYSTDDLSRRFFRIIRIE